MINEKNYIKQLKKKNPEALTFILNKYGNLIFKVAYGVLGNRSLSEECLNDVLLKVWDNASRYEKGDEEFFKWVMVISKYTAIDRVRKEVKSPKTIELEEYREGTYKSLEEDMINKEEVNKLSFEISLMKPKDREIFLRRFYLDETSSEIGEKIGESEKYVNLRIFRGRKKLREKLLKEGI